MNGFDPDKIFYGFIAYPYTEYMFVGRLPMPGEAVEMVCVRDDPEKVLFFRLRVKPGEWHRVYQPKRKTWRNRLSRMFAISQ